MRGVAVMADRGFAVKESLAKIGVDLKIPPFMEGRGQLPVDEMQHCRSIASLRIHVANYIMTVCASFRTSTPHSSLCRLLQTIRMRLAVKRVK